MQKTGKLTVSILLFSLFSAQAFSIPLAFPGAEGAGRFAAGGRGGTVYEVTNLNNSGPGSIVDAVSQPNRTIVFRVSGTIELGDVILRPKSNTTIAGQTAPGDGICIKGRIYLSSADNVIIRYIRVRVDAGGANSSGDAIDIAGGSNIIIDHVSASYARDETISCQDGSNNVTVQWCILSEALTFENHSYGSLIRGQYGERKSYHHNLYAHNKGRNPRPGNYTKIASDPDGLYFDFRNNVVYNWSGTHPGYNADTDTMSRYNFVGNVFICGPGSSGNKAFKEDCKYAYAYWAGNAHGANYNTVTIYPNQWDLVTFNGFTSAEIDAYKARSYEIPMEPVTTTSAYQALQDVLASAGASLVRDPVDQRIVSDVINGTGSFVYNTPLPTDPPEVLNRFWPPLASAPAPTDSDHDGMPDCWETANGLNPSNPADRNSYTLDPDYTNLEVYLNWLVQGDTQPPAAPTGLTAAAGENIVQLAWNPNTEPDLAGYNLYRFTVSGSGYVKLNGILLTSPAYTDTNVSNGTTYYYVVTAVDTSANESIHSVQVSASPMDLTPPAPPAGLWARIENGTVLLDWLDNTEADWAAYSVYRAVGPTGDYILLTNSGITESAFLDTDVSAGLTYYYAVTAKDIYGNESDTLYEVPVTISTTAMGRILRETWTGIAGGTVSHLTAHPLYPNAPSGRDWPANLEGPTNWADSYGTRIRGYLHPPASGWYTFYIAADSEAQLRLSTDGSPANAALIASVSGGTAPRQWDQSPSQRSAPIFLTAEGKYFIEVLHKEDSGSDHLAVAWEGPGLNRQVIAGQYLSPWFVGLYGDTNADEWVDIDDLPAFASAWLETDCAESSAWDLNGDCAVDLYEFSILAGNWMLDIHPLLPPANLTAEADDGAVLLDWDDSAEASVIGYNVYRSTTSGGGYTKLNASPVLSSDYFDDSVQNGIPYYYVVTAVSSGGESAFSNEVSALPNPPNSVLVIQENEAGFCGVEGVIENEHAGYTGSGYANTDNAVGKGITYRIRIAAGGLYTFVWRFANGSTAARPANLLINGTAAVSGIAFPVTGAWTSWSTTAAAQVSLPAGTYTVRLEATASGGLANIDSMTVTGPNLQPAACP
ncbi:MAG TPA: carbohydrate-binding protein [Anaerohalosphaeraceae bacterium]|nr:carbohydrate-binding protein [Anaerohalosphaeraceae bacterium]